MVCSPVRWKEFHFRAIFIPHSAFRIPNSAFAPLQNVPTYGKIEHADESQRNIGSDDRETVARASPLPISK
jgi:hypothetical protein